jgi:hypothetical protein
MRAEVRREFPIALKQGWDYLMDWRLFPQWRVGMVEVLDPETAAWSKPGDKFRFAYRMLGRTVEGECVLEDIREHELNRFTSTVPGLGTVTETWRYQDIDDDLFAISVIMEGSEPTSFFGKVIDRTLMPRVVERDLHRTFDNLHDIFTMGVPE